MRLFLCVVLLTFVLSATAAAVDMPSSVVVTYPPNTPDSILDQAKEAIREAGGTITHEYNLIKGFAAKASKKALQSVSAMSASYNPVIEEDSVVSINSDPMGNVRAF